MPREHWLRLRVVGLHQIARQMSLQHCDDYDDGVTVLLHVNVLEARGLAAADTDGRADPYCVVTASQGARLRTKCQKKTLHPVWGQAFSFTAPPGIRRSGNALTLTVVDHDDFDFDDEMGVAHVPFHDVPYVAPGMIPPGPVWLPLESRHALGASAGGSPSITAPIQRRVEDMGRRAKRQPRGDGRRQDPGTAHEQKRSFIRSRRLLRRLLEHKRNPRKESLGEVSSRYYEVQVWSPRSRVPESRAVGDGDGAKPPPPPRRSRFRAAGEEEGRRRRRGGEAHRVPAGRRDQSERAPRRRLEARYVPSTGAAAAGKSRAEGRAKERDGAPAETGDLDSDTGRLEFRDERLPRLRPRAREHRHRENNPTSTSRDPGGRSSRRATRANKKKRDSKWWRRARRGVARAPRVCVYVNSVLITQPS